MRRFLCSLGLGLAIAGATAFNASAQSLAVNDGQPTATQTQSVDIPKTLSYQGMVASKDGQPVKDGDYAVIVTLYSDANGQTSVWKGTYTAHVTGGVFSLTLGGADQPFPAATKMDGQLFAGVNFNGEEMGSLTPLAAAPYAMNVADGAITAKKMGTDYVGGVTVNGQKLTGKGTDLNIVTDGMDASVDPSTNTLALRGSTIPTIKATGAGAQGNTTITGTLTVTSNTYLRSDAYFGTTGHEANLFLFGTSGTNKADILGAGSYSGNWNYTVPDIGSDGQFVLSGTGGLTQYGVLYGGGSGPISATSVGATGTVLHGNTGAAPTYSQIVNADVSSSAAIDGTKIAADFGNQTVTVGDVSNAGNIHVMDGSGNYVNVTAATQANATQTVNIPQVTTGANFLVSNSPASQTLSSTLNASTGDIKVNDSPADGTSAINDNYLQTQLGASNFVMWDRNAGGIPLDQVSVGIDNTYNAINLTKDYAQIDFDDAGNAADGDLFHMKVLGFGSGGSFTSYSITNATQSLGSNPSGHLVTVTTSADHDLYVGQKVDVSGFTTETGYNGTWTVATVPSTTTFTYYDDATGMGDDAGGSVVLNPEGISQTAKWDAQGILWTNGVNANNLSNYDLGTDLSFSANVGDPLNPQPANFAFIGDYGNIVGGQRSVSLGNGLQDATNWNSGLDARGRLYFNDMSGNSYTDPTLSQTVLVLAPTATTNQTQILQGDMSGNLSIGGIGNGTTAGSILTWDPTQNTGDYSAAGGRYMENTNFIVDGSGNVTNGTWQADVVSPTYGGTGVSDPTQYGVMVAEGSSAMNTVTGSPNTVLHANGSSDPTFGAVDLTADVTAVLPIGNGGTNNAGTSYSDMGVAYYDGANSKITTTGAGNPGMPIVQTVSGPAFQPLDVSDGTNAVNGTLKVTNGGTGVASLTENAIPYGQGVTGDQPFANTGASTVDGQFLQTSTAGSAPSWKTVLGEANGGTNQSTYTTGDMLYASAANTLSKLAGNTTTTANFLMQTGDGSNSAAPVWSDGSANFILNQNAVTQTTANFDISGSGTFGGTVWTDNLGSNANSAVAMQNDLDMNGNSLLDDNNNYINATNTLWLNGTSGQAVGTDLSAVALRVSTPGDDFDGAGAFGGSIAAVIIGQDNFNDLPIITGSQPDLGGPGDLYVNPYSGDVRIGSTTAPSNTLDVTGTIGSTSDILGGATVDAIDGYTVNGSATTGTILRGNGNNYVASTATYPNDVTAGDVLVATSGSTVGSLGIGTQYQVLQSNGSAPVYAAVALNQSAAVTGTLPVGNGGTGTTSYTGNQIVVSNAGGTALISGGAGTTTTVLHGNAGGAPSYGPVIGADITDGSVGNIDLANSTIGMTSTNSTLNVTGSPIALGSSGNVDLNLNHSNAWNADQSIINGHTLAVSGSITSGDATHTGSVILYDNLAQTMTLNVNGTLAGNRTLHFPDPGSSAANVIVEHLQGGGSQNIQSLTLSTALPLTSGGTGVNSVGGGGAVASANDAGNAYQFSNVPTDAQFLTAVVGGGVHTPTWVTMSGNATMTNAGVVTVSSATNFSGTLNGDVTGAQATTTVGKIQNRAVASTAPNNGEVLTWSTANTRWEPAASSVSSMTFTNVTTGVNSQATMTVNTGASLNYSNSGTINASSLQGSTWASPAAIGTGTASSGKFTTVQSTSLGAGVVHSDASGNFTSSAVSLTGDVTGTLPIASGGTGQTSAQAAINSLAGATTSAQYLRGNGTNVVMSAIQASDVPTLNQNTTGTAANVTGTVAIANGGTGQTTAQAALNALAGATTNAQFLRGNGTNVVMAGIQASDVPTLNQNTTGTANNVTGVVTETHGGTNQSSYTTGDVLYASGANTLSKLPIGSTNQVLTVIGGVPTWQAASVSAVSFDNITSSGVSGNTAAAMKVGTGGSLDFVNSGTIHASSAAAVDNSSGAGSSINTALATWNGTLGNNTSGTAAGLSGTNLTGDVTNSGNTVAVNKIKGVSVSATAPTSNQVLAYNSGTTSWTPTSTPVVSNMTATTMTADISGATGTGDGLSAVNTQAGFAGRVNVANITGSSQTTVSVDIYNTNVTTSSIILLTVERNSVSGAYGNEYIANLAYNTSPAGRYITNGTKFRVDVQLRGGTLIPNGNGCTINYMIIN